MNSKNIDLIIQYALIVASQEDEFFEKQLGPIHFIKYVYLADMEYAKYNDGQTFTGVPWNFYRFGPWSQEVNAQIDTALKQLDVVEQHMPSNHCEDDYVRWTLDDSEQPMIASVKESLPPIIKTAVKKYVHKYKNETATLLHFVYMTLPMLYAAPGENLDFSLMVKPPVPTHIEQRDNENKFTPLLERLSKSKKATLKSKMDSLKDRFQEKLKNKKGRSQYRPKYDKIYEDGVQWLDEIAGLNFPESDTNLKIEDSVWKSKARRGNE